MTYEKNDSRELYYFYVDSSDRWHLLEPGKPVPEDVGNIKRIFCTDSEDTKDDLLASNQKVAPPGIIYVMRCSDNTHYTMTWEVLRGEGFSGDSLKVLAAGARDVDLYKFAFEPAHATSFQDKNGRPIKELKENAQSFIDWMKKLEKLFSSALEGGKFQEALYIFGWMCHGIQDLYVHRGMTPREHIWLGTHEQNPDKNFDNDDCRDWTVKLYRKLRDRYKLNQYGDEFFEISAPPFKRCEIKDLNDSIWNWGRNISEMGKFVGTEIYDHFKDFADYIQIMFGTEPEQTELYPAHDWINDLGEDWFWGKL